jgi:pimeloyl-ACP methyl ester carboxylesterase
MSPMPILSARDVHVFYDRRGRAGGAGVVFLHGLGSSSSDWALQVPSFEERHRVILVDLPGHGQSRATRWARSIEGMAGDVAALLADLQEPPAHVVGLSLGGCVALALALRSPEHVRSLTLVNAFARLRPADARALFRMLTRATLLAVAPMRTVAAHVARGLFPRADQEMLYRAAVDSLSRTPRRAYIASARALLGFDVADRLDTIKAPTLVIAGGADRTIPLVAKEDVARRISGARLVVFPDSGHATPMDEPAAFNDSVLEFIAAH